jgi:hypothetical protein
VWPGCVVRLLRLNLLILSCFPRQKMDDLFDLGLDMNLDMVPFGAPEMEFLVESEDVSSSSSKKRPNETTSESSEGVVKEEVAGLEILMFSRIFDFVFFQKRRARAKRRNRLLRKSRTAKWRTPTFALFPVRDKETRLRFLATSLLS